MLTHDLRNPYSKPFSNVGKKLLSSSLNPTYNTKCKYYPDGSMNLCISKNDIFGRDERNYQIKNTAFTDFKDFHNYYRKKDCIEFMEFQRSRILSDIDVYFKSVDNFLLFSSQSRKVDDLYIHDSIIWGGNSLSAAEQSFLKSLRNSIRQDNLKKTRDTIFDYVLCNEWEYFFTGTIDQKKFDAFNAEKLKKPLKKWLNHMQERYGLSYIVIFEYHKKGGIHIHGLLRSSPLTPLRLVESGTRSYYGFKKPMKDSTALKRGLDINKGQIVYNLVTWKFGFSTAIKVYGSQGAIAHYVTKYITKSNQKIMGRYFWHSQDLKKPNVFFINSDYDSLQLANYHGFKYLYQSTNDLYQEYTDIDYQDNEDNENNFISGWVDI